MSNKLLRLNLIRSCIYSQEIFKRFARPLKNLYLVGRLHGDLFSGTSFEMVWSLYRLLREQMRLEPHPNGSMLTT